MATTYTKLRISIAAVIIAAAVTGVISFSIQRASLTAKPPLYLEPLIKKQQQL